MAGDTAVKARYAEHIGNPDYHQIVCKAKEDLKGKVLIINNMFKGTGLERFGGEMDVKNLKQLFEKVGHCEVTTETDVNTNDFIQVLERFVDKGPQACFYAVFIMSHGTDKEVEDVSYDMIRGNDRGLVNVLDLMNILTNEKRKHLLEAPVMMFVQACRGRKADRRPKNYPPEEVIPRSDDGEDLADNADSEANIRMRLRGIRDRLIALLPNARLIDSPDDEGDDVPDAGPNEQCLGTYSESCCQNDASPPNEGAMICNEQSAGSRREDTCPDMADYLETDYVKEAPNTLVSFATLEGYQCFRNKQHGSWFIQDLCSVFEASFHNQDVVSMMESVHNKISKRRVDNTTIPELHGCAVCSRTAHTFGKKKLFLFPGLPSSI